jgi:DNA-binding NarL/FixJ family response regulator
MLTARILPRLARNGAAAIIAIVTRIAVVADDLIWASRLSDAVRRAGAEPCRVRGGAAIEGIAAATSGCHGAIVDTALMTAEPMAVISALAGVGLPVLAVANHDDVALRKRALAAGAGKVLAYRKLHEDGQAVVSAWLRSLPAGVP